MLGRDITCIPSEVEVSVVSAFVKLLPPVHVDGAARDLMSHGRTVVEVYLEVVVV